MQNNIVIKGICTNNLKSIDVELEKEGINLLLGPSGSGKSSLAYQTIGQIGQHEYFSLFADDVYEPTYKVSSFYNMLPTVPIRQTNNNNNLHSTIGTYFGISHKICLLFSSLLNIDDSFFSLNKEENLCPKCHGLGVVPELDLAKIISPNKKLNENPFRCWNKYKDFYSQILMSYCNDNNIDSDLYFCDLSQSQKNTILYGVSNNKYSVKYKKNGQVASRTTKYFGPLTGHIMLTNHSISKSFYSNTECDKCYGMKYSEDHYKIKLNGLSIGEYLTKPFEDLLPVFEILATEHANGSISFAISVIRNFIKKAIELQLGHLNFNRSIPTLSGGELQRLKLVQVFNSQLSNLLVVLDEPLAGLSDREKKIIQRNIVQLSLHNTILVVDYGSSFISVAKKIICLGPAGGTNGGMLVNVNEYIDSISKPLKFQPEKKNKITTISNHNRVYQYRGFSICIMDNALNLFVGESGIGKSTLLREYLPQAIDSYCYINQKPIFGNKNSCVATALNISSRISNLFASKYKKDKRFFSNHTGNLGCCKKCLGSGFLVYGDSFTTENKIECNECWGTGFSKELVKYTIEKKSIFDIWKMTIDEATVFFGPIDKTVCNVFCMANSLMLGHLRIGQTTSSLSGGESIRVKLLRESSSQCSVLGIDEPFKGLNPNEQYAVGSFLETVRKKGKTILVIDHTEGIEFFFSHKQIIRNIKNILVGSAYDVQ